MGKASERGVEMKVCTSSICVTTSGHSEVVDITDRIGENLRASGLKEGVATVFSVGSTAGVTTVEFEPGLVKDLKMLFEKLVPEKADYFHEETWHDGNGYAHVRSSLLKTSVSIPFAEGRMLLGKWQQVVFIDFDNRSRGREVVTQFIGR